MICPPGSRRGTKAEDSIRQGPRRSHRNDHGEPGVAGESRRHISGHVGSGVALGSAKNENRQAAFNQVNGLLGRVGLSHRIGIQRQIGPRSGLGLPLTDGKSAAVSDKPSPFRPSRPAT